MDIEARYFDSIQRPAVDVTAKPGQVWKPVMVGDLVERGLTAIGITKDRVERITRTEGKPGGCGCSSRKRWLNDAGAKVQVSARSALERVKRATVGD